jgi:hypothetical protein
MKLDLRKISFRPTGEEIEYLAKLNTQRYRADTVTKLMHALLTDIIRNSNIKGYSKHFKNNNMLDTAYPLEGLGSIPIHSSNSINNEQKDIVTMWVEGMEKVARYKKAVDIINGRYNPNQI